MIVSCLREVSAPQPGQLPARRADDQHVRGALRLAGARVRPAGDHVDRGLVCPQRRLGGQRLLHGLVEPGVLQPAVEPAAGLIDKACGDGDPGQHADQVRGPLGRDVPVTGQQQRSRVHPRPVGHAAPVRPGRRVRHGSLPAARAGQRRQQPFGYEPAEPHVPDLRPDLRPARRRRLRAIQAHPASRALRRRICALLLVRVRVPLQPGAGMTPLASALAIRAPLPLRDLPLPLLRRVPLPRPDALLRAGRPGVRAVLAEAALQLRHPQLKQPPVLCDRVQLRAQRPERRAQRRKLGVLRLDNRPQAGHQLTLLPAISRQTRRIGHKPRSCSTSARSSNIPHVMSPTRHAPPP